MDKMSPAKTFDTKKPPGRAGVIHPHSMNIPTDTKLQKRVKAKHDLAVCKLLTNNNISHCR